MILRSNPRLIGEPEIPEKSALLKRLASYVPSNEPTFVLKDRRGNFHGHASDAQVRDLTLIHDQVLALLREKKETDVASLPFMYMGEIARPQDHPLCRFHRDDAHRFVWVEGDPNFIAVEGELDTEEETVHEATLKALHQHRVRKRIFPTGWVYGVDPEDVHCREAILGHGEGAIRHLMSFDPELSDSFLVLVK